MNASHRLLCCVVLAGMATPAMAAAKVDVCHWSGSTATVKSVAANTVASHFAHGDSYPSLYFRDSDGDAFGDPSGATDRCPNPGYVADHTDCNDHDSSVHYCLFVEVSLFDADAEYTGPAGAKAGTSVAGAGDVNGDDYADVLVGAPNDAGKGAAYLVLGGPSPTSGSLSGADAKYTGEASGDSAGNSVSGAGDIDGDGYDDVLVGAYKNDAGGVDAGAVYVVLGSASPTSLSLSAADAVYTGTGLAVVGQGDWVGTSMAGVGDVNGDDYDDILVGADFDGHLFGGDLGRVYLLLGDGLSPASAPVADAAAVFYQGSGTGSLLGYSVAAAGDVDADGLDDFLMGAPAGTGTSQEAHTYLGLGDSSSFSGGGIAWAVDYTGEILWDLAGSSVAGAGDVDADGYDDFLVGAPGNDDGGTDAGAAYLVLGGPSPASASLSAADAEYIGESSGDGAGLSVAGAGDLDGDSYDDILVDASSDDDGGVNAGAAYLVLGGPSPATASLSVADFKYVGEAAADSVGAVAGAGDVDDDGHPDVLVGGALNDDGGTDAGAAYLLLGGGL